MKRLGFFKHGTYGTPFQVETLREFGGDLSYGVTKRALLSELLQKFKSRALWFELSFFGGAEFMEDS